MPPPDYRARHPGFEPTNPPPPDDDAAQPRRSMRILPWWRRATAWVRDFHNFVGAVAGIAAATIAAHVWIQGLVRRGDVEAEVRRAVVAAMLDVNTDLAKMKGRTGDDFPPWRASVDDRLKTVEIRAGVAEQLGQKANDRFDQYFAHRGALR